MIAEYRKARALMASLAQSSPVWQNLFKEVDKVWSCDHQHNLSPAPACLCICHQRLFCLLCTHQFLHSSILPSAALEF